MKRIGGLFLSLVVSGATQSVAGVAPLAVSPGSPEQVALTEARCPTFSWGEVESASSYELVVYRVGLGGDAKSVDVVFTRTFPGAVRSWTPSLESCLVRGQRYGWSVRAMLREGASDWSAPSLFEVASSPPESELADALEVVQRYLDSERPVAEQPRESNQGGRGIDMVSAPLRIAGAHEILESATAVSEAEAKDLPGSADAESPLAPTLVSIVTEGAVGVGTESPMADLHVVGEPTLGALLLAPSEPTSHQDSELILAEDNDGTYAMKLRYDGATNKLEVWGRDLSGELGPWLQIDRDDGRIAAEKWNPDPPCFSSSERFVDCGNGTVMDTVRGLLWLKDASCSSLGTPRFVSAGLAAAGLESGECGLSDGSRAGDWRVPTKEEWEPLLASACPTDPKVVGENTACYTDGAWALDLRSSVYWTSTTVEADPTKAYLVETLTGTFRLDPKSYNGYVWPVRDGQ